jgi:hypothetical protein
MKTETKHYYKVAHIKSGLFVKILASSKYEAITKAKVSLRMWEGNKAFKTEIVK